MKLVRCDAAKAALAAVAKIDEVKDIRDKATAMEAYAYQARDPDLACYSVDVKRRAVRRLGELMEKEPKAKGGGDQRSKHRVFKKPSVLPSLKEQKIDKNLANAARKEAKLSEDQFERSVEDAKKIAVAAASGDKAIVRARKGSTEKRMIQEWAHGMVGLIVRR